MNIKRSFYNIFFGMLSQIISIVLGIVIPRLVLISLGSESNGLLSSINQALVYLSLLEAGIGTATLQALYKPVAEKDKGGSVSCLPFLWVSEFPARARSPSWFRSGLCPRRTAPAPRRRTPARRCAP